MVEVMFCRLLEMAGIDKNEIWSWIDAPSISLDEVVAKREQGIAGNAEPYGDT